MLDPVYAAPPDPRDLLSPRELEVLEMASLGLTNSEIGRRLHVSVHAVKFHLAAIYRKLGVANRTEAAVAYLRSTSARPAAGDLTA
ncbi:MAG TPA: LuxR C-terminal-related transcriptional regulator [Gaiellaceae bacterium]